MIIINYINMKENFGNMETLDELKEKYIGKKVYAGSRMKGYYGTITDIVPDEDGFPEYWYIVTNKEEGSQRWAKSELKKVVITTTLAPLD